MDQVTNAKTQIRLEQWRKIIADCQSSGMPVYKWCEQNGVKEQSDYSGTLRATCPDFESHHSGEWEPYIPVIQSHLIVLYYIYFLYTVNTHLWCEYR